MELQTMKIAGLFLSVLLVSATTEAQKPARRSAAAGEVRRTDPVLRYTLRATATDTTGFAVDLHVSGTADTIRLAMAAHPEYDDRFWRYVEDLRVESTRGAASIVREDSALWRVVIPRGEGTVRYRIRFPAPEGALRASWRPFLSATGGLVGGPHAFMYIVGATDAPAHVALDIPAEWRAASGLEPTSDPRIHYAPSAELLIDSPILVGRFSDWAFAIDGVPHRVVYWPLPNATPFDSIAFVDGVQRLARQTVSLFGRAPFREYTFLFQDAAYGGLEHMNSVSLGAPSVDLARGVHGHLMDTAHEYVHTWNLMRIRPAERGGLNYRTAGQSAGLWFSEGLTMFYADLLLRRAGLPVPAKTRIAHLESSIARYLFNSGNAAVSPERASLAEYGAPYGSLGDYDPSPHLQGELLGAMLDLIVRDAQDAHSMDDVMRLMLARFGGAKGFVGTDVERAVGDVCACDVRPFFEKHVRRANAIDFDRYLQLIGLRARVSWTPALGANGQPEQDYRLRGWVQPGDSLLTVHLSEPRSTWGRAGLHMGDRIAAINGAPVKSWPEMRAVIFRASIGDTLRFDIRRKGIAHRVNAEMRGYERPVVRIEELPDATPRQRALRARWIDGS